MDATFMGFVMRNSISVIDTVSGSDAPVAPPLKPLLLFKCNTARVFARVATRIVD